jgi:hypothetical protein
VNVKHLAFVGVLVLAGCTSTTVTTKPDTTAATKAAAATSSAAGKAHVGDTITLTEPGKKFAVTLVKVGPTTATDGFSTPPPGDGYWAAQLRIVNTGTAAIQGVIESDVTGQDAQGQSYQTDFVSGITAGPMFPTPLTLAPGGTALGWVVLDVPTGTTVTSVQFAALAGTGNTAQWLIP